VSEYWYLLPYAALAAMLVVYWLVRLAIDWFDHLQRRRIKPYSQVYGGAFYMGNHRTNYRRPG
jgi:hypothetical protein